MIDGDPRGLGGGEGPEQGQPKGTPTGAGSDSAWRSPTSKRGGSWPVGPR